MCIQYTCPKARINDFIISYVLKIVVSKRFSQLFSNSLTASYQLHSRDCKFLIFLELAELIGVRAEQLCPLNVVPKQFFVNMVSLSTEYQPDVNFLIFLCVDSSQPRDGSTRSLLSNSAYSLSAPCL